MGLCRLDAVHRGPVSRACRRCGPKPPETLRPTDSRARSDLCVLARIAPLFSIFGTTRLSLGASWGPSPSANSRPIAAPFMLRRAPSKSYRRLHGGLLSRCASAIPSFPGARSWVSETSCGHNYDDVAEEQVSAHSPRRPAGPRSRQTRECLERSERPKSQCRCGAVRCGKLGAAEGAAMRQVACLLVSAHGNIAGGRILVYTNS